VKIAEHQQRRRHNLLLAAFINAAFASLVAVPPNANAACMVTTTGTVSCNADTTTTNTTNLDGINPVSSDRTQLFDNGAAINGTVQSGVTVGGFGLQLTEGAAAPLPITMNNQGQVTTTQAVDALHIDGNGGPISYSGKGGVTNTTSSDAALFVDNVGGNVSIVTGAGTISGATGINASTIGAGAVTITTGSGLVGSTAGPGILASTANGPLSITVGTGGIVSKGNNSAVVATSTLLPMATF
jgi:fibronectin-binding autotransporter adhesin